MDVQLINCDEMQKLIVISQGNSKLLAEKKICVKNMKWAITRIR